MNKDYKILKKNYGENFAKLCRELFPSLLEKEGLLSNLILSKFYPNHYLYEDIINNEYIDNFKNYIYSLTNTKEEITKTENSVKELFSIAGYDFYECKRESDIQKFKKYYEKKEELCTFHGGRLNNCYVFFAVKKNVDDIRRENFKNPKRQDEYGTSVISIQFSRKGHTLSIKNRYNHTVNNPDATFSNNLENIIPGLTYAFEREYDLHINQNESKNFELPYYVLASDNKYYKYNYEMFNIYYCPDNIIIDNGKIKKLEKEKCLLIDYFILDLVEKEIYTYDAEIKDYFDESIDNIEKITIQKINEAKWIIIAIKEKENIILKLDKYNRIIYLEDKNIIKIKNDYLYATDSLEEINLPYVIEIKDNFLYSSEKLKRINIPNVVRIGNSFLCCNMSLKSLELPNVISINNEFLYENNILEKIDIPRIVKIKDSFMFHNECLKRLKLEYLESMGDDFLYCNKLLEELDCPNLQEAGYDDLFSNNSLKRFNFPKLKRIKGNFLKNNKRWHMTKLLKKVRKR